MRVADDADAERVRDADRCRQQTRLAHPLQAGQLAVAVEPVAAGEERCLGRDDHRHARAHRVAFDQGRVADAHARDVGDGVLCGRDAVADRDAQVSGPHVAWK